MPYTDNAHAIEHPCRNPRLCVVLANKHTIVRRGLWLLLHAEIDLKVVGEASDVVDTLAFVRDLQPDVLITDVSLDTGAGIRAIGDFRRECPTMRIVLLTYRDSRQGTGAAIEADVDAYISRDSPVEDLLRAIRCGSTECRQVIPELADRSRSGSSLSPVEESINEMTPRQREVLIGVALGYSTKSIAGHLGRSIRTVEKHRLKMMHKLGLRNAAAVARYAIDHGFLDPTRQTQNWPRETYMAP